MKASELRIGNYVMAINNYEDIFYVNCIYGHRDLNITAGMYINYDTSIRNIKPRRITEAWLIKFGFNKDDNEFRLPKIKGFKDSAYEICIRLYNDFCDVLLEEEELNVDTFAVILPSKLEYVHQLQNLYFALIGEELTIKK